ncbi:MAG TPA: AbrB/MazE/SpoVT family DNA-binding domain-containing protein [Nitrososphaeraceae archaeon]
MLFKYVMIDVIEIRKVQAYSGERSFTIVLPKVFSEKLRIGKGDFLKVHLENERIILEKADL